MPRLRLWRLMQHMPPCRMTLTDGQVYKPRWLQERARVKLPLGLSKICNNVGILPAPMDAIKNMKRVAVLPI